MRTKIEFWYRNNELSEKENINEIEKELLSKGCVILNLDVRNRGSEWIVFYVRYKQPNA